MKHTLQLNDEHRQTLFAAMRDIGEYQCTAQETLGKSTAEKKADGSIVTDVDKESQRRITKILTEILPYPVLGEENDASVNNAIMNSDGPIWVVDPLDGTKSYSEGYNEFGINVALLDKPDNTGNRHAVFGAVYFPAKRELFYTNARSHSCLVSVAEDGAFSTPQMLRCNKELKDTQPIRIAIGYNDNGMPRFSGSGHILAHSKHTGAYRTARVLKDDYHVASFDAPAAIWDIAALDALVRGAGGRLYSLHANGSISDTPYFGADATRYDDGTLFRNPPYLCMHERMLRELADAGPVISEGARHQR